MESTKVRHLKDELAEYKSNYANLEVVAAEAKQLHAETHSAMEAKYVSWCHPLKASSRV
jgi:hypothetical protein